MSAKIVRPGPGGKLSPEDLREVSSAVAAGRTAVFPTDTVYGIGTTALVRAAARRLYDAKAREPMKPLPILVHSPEEARRWVVWTPAAEALAARFWPGPLTLVLPPTREGRRLAPAEFATLGIRVPAHPVILALLEASGVPWASTSANLSGSPALKDGAAAVAAFERTVDFIVDAGTVGGRESSVVDASGARARILREGCLSREEVSDALGSRAE